MRAESGHFLDLDQLASAIRTWPFPPPISRELRIVLYPKSGTKRKKSKKSKKSKRRKR